MFAKPVAPAPKPVIEKQAGIDSGTTTKHASIDSGMTAKQASVDLGTTMKEVSINSGKTAKQDSVDSGTAGNEPSSEAVTSGKRFSFKTLAHAVVRQMSISEIEKEQKELCPKVEGRIFHFDDEVCMGVHQILLLLRHSIRKCILLSAFLTWSPKWVDSWVKVFRINPEFRILRLTFHRKSASKCWIREIILASLINF